MTREIIQAHIFYSGMVQGVGFRYTVQRFAGGLGLTGWVRNLPDRRVEALVEGKKDDIDELLRSVEMQFGGYIKECKVELADYSGQFVKFMIL